MSRRSWRLSWHSPPGLRASSWSWPWRAVWSRRVTRPATAPLADPHPRPLRAAGRGRAAAYYVYARRRRESSTAASSAKAVMAFRTGDLDHWEDPVAVWEVPADHWGRETGLGSRGAPLSAGVTTSSSPSRRPRRPAHAPKAARATWAGGARRSSCPTHPWALFDRWDADRRPRRTGWPSTAACWVEDGAALHGLLHEWVQITDGSFDVVRLSEDLKAAVAAPPPAPVPRFGRRPGCGVAATSASSTKGGGITPT